MTADEIAALFKSRSDAWARQDAAALAANYAEDCIVESPMSGLLRGRVAVEQVYRHWFAAFPDIVFESRELLSVGNRAVEVFTIYGTDTGGFLGHAPTRRRFRFEGVILDDLVDGRIQHERRVYDLHGLMMHLTSDPTSGQTPSEVYQMTVERARMAQELRTAAEIQRLLLPAGDHRGSTGICTILRARPAPGALRSEERTDIGHLSRRPGIRGFSRSGVPIKFRTRRGNAARSNSRSSPRFTWMETHG